MKIKSKKNEIREYKSTEIVKAIQWDGSNAGEIENIIRAEVVGCVMRRGNSLLVDTDFLDISLEIGDYLIVKGQSVRAYNEELFNRCYVTEQEAIEKTRKEEREKAVKAFSSYMKAEQGGVLQLQIDQFITALDETKTE